MSLREGIELLLHTPTPRSLPHLSIEADVLSRLHLTPLLKFAGGGGWGAGSREAMIMCRKYNYDIVHVGLWSHVPPRYTIMIMCKNYTS